MIIKSGYIDKRPRGTYILKDKHTKWTKVRLTVFPKSNLATQRHRFQLDTTLLKKNQPFHICTKVPNNLAYWNISSSSFRTSFTKI